MKVLILLALVACVYGIPRLGLRDRQWEAFKNVHNKQYSASEEWLRRGIFRRNLNKIFMHNRLFDQGLKSFKVGINEHSDLTEAEQTRRNGFKPSLALANKSRRSFAEVALGDVPATVDWRTKGVVTPVKDQGQCGSCWAFAAVASMEGQHALKNGKLVSLSEQNLVDCDTTDSGCEGGLPDNAFQYVIQNNGIDTEASYPYEAMDDTCRFNAANVGATVASYQDIDQNEDAIKKAVATVGPIAVGIDANHPEFMSYTSGIFDIDDCTTQLDHGVTIVGYGTENGKDYWLIKNSWGTTWGISGYVKFARGKNLCGINLLASYPTV